MYENDTEQKQTSEDGKPAAGLAESAKLAAKWSTELSAAKKWRDKFNRTAKQIEKVFLDQRDGAEKGESRVNLFWANVNVTLSAIYGRLPKAEVDRKFRDADDDVARVASEILQRTLNNDIEREHDDTSAAMRDAVQDRFVVGMGQVWCRYDVETETIEQPVLDMMGQPVVGEDGKPVTQKVERILNEEAETDYVNWEDFLYSPCKRWRDCRWVARRVPMSKSQIMKRFKLTEQQCGMIPMNAVMKDADSQDVDKATPYRQAAVWEIWCKTTNMAYWYVEGCSFILDKQVDPLQLDDFFPCPQPVVATTGTKAFLPVADYRMAQSMYQDLDECNNRLHILQKAIRVAGTYNKNEDAVKRLVNGEADNVLIPVENWSAFVEAGGLKGAVDWMPLDQTVNAMEKLSIRKKQLENDLYEVLGLSDIMRGASVASETATAQQLKVQYGGARLANMQNEVARFVSAVSRIRANIIANHFQPQTLIQRSGIDRTKDAPLADQAIALIKQFGTAMHTIQVTADSLAAPDWQAEKEQRVELLTAVGGFISQALPVAQNNPQAGVFMLQMLQWGVAGFKSGRSLEGMLDQAIKSMEQAAAQPPAPPQPDPKVVAQAKKDDAQARKYGAEAQAIELENQVTGSMLQPQLPPINSLPNGLVPPAPNMPMVPPSPLPTNPM